VSGNAIRHQLVVINPDGTGEMCYPPGGPEVVADWVACSPEGRGIAYVSSDDHEVWVMDGDGMHRVRLTELGARISAPPSWSPGGRRNVRCQQFYLCAIGDSIQYLRMIDDIPQKIKD
jgi:hypothetical protein